MIYKFNQMAEQDFPRSTSPALPAKNPEMQLDEEGRMVQVVPCTICGRKFAVDRIQVSLPGLFTPGCESISVNSWALVLLMVLWLEQFIFAMYNASDYRVFTLYYGIII